MEEANLQKQLSEALEWRRKTENENSDIRAELDLLKAYMSNIVGPQSQYDRGNTTSTLRTSKGTPIYPPVNPSYFHQSGEPR